MNWNVVASPALVIIQDVCNALDGIIVTGVGTAQCQEDTHYKKLVSRLDTQRETYH